LSQGFQDVLSELGELVEKQDPVVGQADLTRLGVWPPPIRPASEMV
jgi:hypothetical protein